MFFVMGKDFDSEDTEQSPVADDAAHGGDSTDSLSMSFMRSNSFTGSTAPQPPETEEASGQTDSGSSPSSLDSLLDEIGDSEWEMDDSAEALTQIEEGAANQSEPGAGPLPRANANQKASGRRVSRTLPYPPAPEKQEPEPPEPPRRVSRTLPYPPAPGSQLQPDEPLLQSSDETATLLKSAESCMERAQFDEARRHLESALKILDSNSLADKAQLLQCLRNLADVYMFFGEPESALTMRRRLFDLGDGQPDRSFIIVLSQVITARQRSADQKALEALYVEALETARALLPADDPLRLQLQRSWTEFQSKQLAELAPPATKRSTGETERSSENLAAYQTGGRARLEPVAQPSERFDTGLKSALDQPAARSFLFSPKMVTPILVSVLFLLSVAMFTVLHRRPGESVVSQGGAFEKREYRACDGAKIVKLDSATDCTVTDKGRQIHGHYKMVGDDDFISLMTSPSQSGEIWLQKSEIGLTDKDGTVLYPPDAPESRLARQILTYGDLSGKYFRENKSYPGDKEKLAAATGAAFHYINPYTGKVAEPSIIYKRFAASEPVWADQGRAGLPWTDEPHWQPGEIHFVCLDYCRLFIRGFDKNSRPLTGSIPGIYFCIELKDGVNVTAEQLAESGRAAKEKQNAPATVYITTAPGLQMTVQTLRTVLPISLLLIVLAIVGAVVRQLIITKHSRTTAHDTKFTTQR